MTQGASRARRRRKRPSPKVPPLLLSEAENNYDAMNASASRLEDAAQSFYRRRYVAAVVEPTSDPPRVPVLPLMA